MELAEAVASELALFDRVSAPEDRMAATRAIGADAIADAARVLISAPPTLALVGRAGRRDHLSGLERRLGPPRRPAAA